MLQNVASHEVNRPVGPTAQRINPQKTTRVRLNVSNLYPESTDASCIHCVLIQIIPEKKHFLLSLAHPLFQLLMCDLFFNTNIFHK